MVCLVYVWYVCKHMCCVKTFSVFYVGMQQKLLFGGIFKPKGMCNRYLSLHD
jgi:hypothetical protein